MAKVYVSPGVYTEEKDLSYYNKGLAASSLGLVGETKLGPAFQPIKITNMGQFRDIFGDEDPAYHLPYVAKSYFKYGGTAYVSRVLGDEAQNTGWKIWGITTTGVPFGNVVAVIGTPQTVTGITIGGGSGGNINTSTGIAIQTQHNPAAVNSYIISLDTSSPRFITNVFPRTSTTADCVTFAVYPYGTVANDFVFSAPSQFSALTNIFDVSGYSNAHTPTVVSMHGTELFRLHTISDGILSNIAIKATIENIDTTANTFDVLVRTFDDMDYRQNVLERYTRCSMDPLSANYICKMIGDSRTDDGNYTQISNYIYVEVMTGNHKNRVPAGHKGWYGPYINTGSTIAIATKPLYKTGYTITDSVSRTYMGIDYSLLDTDSIMGSWGSAWDEESSLGSYITGFHFDSAASISVYNVGVYSIDGGYTKEQLKFNIPFIGGKDGWRKDQQTRDLLTDSPSTTQLSVWSSAIDALSNTEEFDINLLAVPGVAISSTIGEYAIDMAETRADCLYIGDMKSGLTSPVAAVNDISAIDSNYAATYWPYVQFYDSLSESNVWIPATAAALRSIAYTDSISYPWFAPAGMNRGLIGDVNKAKYRLTLAERDTLYEGKINPIATMQGDVVIWGQKTLQTNTTALDRINVRRLLLYTRKVIANIAKYLVFAQNDTTTWDRFKAEVNPILESVKNKNGLYDFRVIMDETTNTDDIIDRNQMVGQIYLQPTKTSEMITINFNIMATGAVFDE